MSGSPKTNDKSPHVLSPGFENPENFACGIQWNSGLTMGIRNLVSSTIRNPKLSTDSIWNPEAKAWNPESKTVLDNFTWGEIKKQVFPGQWLR